MKEAWNYMYDTLFQIFQKGQTDGHKNIRKKNAIIIDNFVLLLLTLCSKWIMCHLKQSLTSFHLSITVLKRFSSACYIASKCFLRFSLTLAFNCKVASEWHCTNTIHRLSWTNKPPLHGHIILTIIY